MTNSKKFFLLICISFLFFTSCKDPKEYRVDSSFDIYLQRFETEGASHGHTFDVQSSGLIIEFGNLPNNDAGLTHYEKPIRIQIDKTYWSDISGSAGADLMKEDLIFHELGHGLLNRNHLNTTLENGDWKSIMCGGDKQNNRSWNINYHGMRRSYYIDELFNESTKAPDFGSLILPADTTGYSTYTKINFDTPAQSGWRLIDSLYYKTNLDNGRLHFQSKVKDIYLVFAKIDKPIDINSNFSYELTLNYPTGDNTNQYGLIFGPIPQGSSGINDPIEYFTINNNQNMYMGNRSWYSYFTELSEKSIIKSGSNKLKVFKIGKLLYYFINNVYCYSSEIEVTTNVNQFGFMVPAFGDVWVDNFQISQQGSANAPSKVKQNLQFEFRMQSTDKFNLGNIKNN